MIAYGGSHGVLCTSAAPAPQPVVNAGQLQCSSPLTVIDGLYRSGVAPYPSDTDPPGGTDKPGSYTVRGFARADAREVTVADQRGRHWRAELSRVWTSAARQPGDLAGIRGPLRERLERLPSRARVRSFFVAIPAPPDASDGRGLRIETRLEDGGGLSQP
jgi:hypothetical protein